MNIAGILQVKRGDMLVLYHLINSQNLILQKNLLKIMNQDSGKSLVSIDCQ